MTQASSANPGTLSLLCLGLMLTVMIATVAAALMGVINGQDAARYVGMVFSVLMIGAGNLLPKRTLPGSRVVKSARIAGWLLVGGGLLSLGLWLWAPAETRILSASGTALVLFAVALLAAVRYVRVAGPDTGGRRSGAQQAIVHILHGLMWAFAFFVAQVLAGKDAVLWLTAGFAASMSLLQAVMASGRNQA